MIHKIRGTSRRVLVPVLLIAACTVAFPPPGAEAAPRGEKEKPPPVVGAMTPEGTLGLSPAWEEVYVLYKPDGESLSAIHAALEENRGRIRAEVVLGTWCSDSRKQVPKYLKILDIVGRNLLPTRIAGVDRSMKVTVGEFQARSVKRVPTFILYKGDEEIGRIIETPQGSMEEHLAAILKRPEAG